ncbi:helix-turn-helix domain-containing protein [Microbacterium hominis]|uniref:helix-turn-helix transcriptional regulator n=1 Tax=Microbacterium hominis TaxID=162426 RepID=UPI00168BF663|nr:helix-turn-helix domain-containing protein [Microbacterium hominis]QOC24796.1 helix-turn-helix domain-containing protein [Microbacterium hominis]QOC28850.1 helix-turn-helix domain-containing protein [Microbacterium hominis]
MLCIASPGDRHCFVRYQQNDSVFQEGVCPLSTVSTHVGSPELPEVASRGQVSEFTGLSVPTLARWAAEGKGPRFRRAGGRVLYRRADVIAWLDSLDAGGEGA